MIEAFYAIRDTLLHRWVYLYREHGEPVCDCRHDDMHIAIDGASRRLRQRSLLLRSDRRHHRGVSGGGLVGSLIFARWILRMRAFLMIAVGYLASSVFLVVFSRVPAVYPLLFVSGLVAGICLVGTQNLLNAKSARLYPPAIRSTGVGWAIGVGRFRAILGPSIAGSLLAFHFSGTDLFLFAAVPPAVAGLIAFVLLRTLRPGV